MYVYVYVLVYVTYRSTVSAGMSKVGLGAGSISQSNRCYQSIIHAKSGAAQKPDGTVLQGGLEI